jgi:hypothetical protein
VVTPVTTFCVTCGNTGWREVDIPKGFVVRCGCRS